MERSVRGASSPWRTSLGGSLELAVGGGLGVAEETRARGAALPAVSREPARSCGESQRELASRLARPELNRSYASCRVDGTSRLAPSRHHKGAGNLHGLVAALSVDQAPRYKDPRVQSDPLVYEVVFSLYICVKVVAPSPVK